MASDISAERGAREVGRGEAPRGQHLTRARNAARKGKKESRPGDGGGEGGRIGAERCRLSVRDAEGRAGTARAGRHAAPGHGGQGGVLGGKRQPLLARQLEIAAVVAREPPLVRTHGPEQRVVGSRHDLDAESAKPLPTLGQARRPRLAVSPRSRGPLPPWRTARGGPVLPRSSPGMRPPPPTREGPPQGRVGWHRSQARSVRR